MRFSEGCDKTTFFSGLHLVTGLARGRTQSVDLQPDIKQAVLTPFCVPNEGLLAYRQEVSLGTGRDCFARIYVKRFADKTDSQRNKKTPYVTSHHPIIFGLLDGAPSWLRNVMPSKSRFRQTAAPKYPLYALLQAIAVRRTRKSAFTAHEHSFQASSTRHDVRQFGEKWRR